MSSAADRRAEAIERISKVRAEVEAKEAEKVAKAEAVKQRKREQGTAQSLEDLIKVGKARGMKNPYGWAHNVFKARQKK